MHAQRRIAEEGDMDAARCVVRGTVERLIILREAGGISDRFAESHVMEEPIWASGPGSREGVGGGPERRAEKIAFIVPIAEITAEKHGEDRFDIAEREIIRTANSVAGVPASAAGAVSPEIAIRVQRGEKGAIRDVDVVAAAEERGEIAPAVRGKSFAAGFTEIIANYATLRQRQQGVSKFVVFV